MKEDYREFVAFNLKLPHATWKLLKFISVNQMRPMNRILEEWIELKRKKFEENS